MPLDDWKAASPIDEIRPSLVARARKRQVEPGKRGHWSVAGSGSAGDHYDRYDVFLSEGHKLKCSCQIHQGGEFRRLCSHIVAVMLYREQHGDHQGPVETEEPVIVPLVTAPTVLFVEPDEDDDAKIIPLRGFDLETFDEPPPLNHPMFGSPPVPDKFKQLYPNQWKATREILDHLRAGVKVVLLDAPTGSGKTIIGEVTRRLYAGKVPVTYMCSTKTLQEQVIHDFPYARVLKGRANYPTLERPDLTADDCVMELTKLPACVNCPQAKEGVDSWGLDQHAEDTKHCPHCHPYAKCPYQEAKRGAVLAELSVLNIAYYLAETQGYGSQFFGRNLVVIDEADVLEGELLRHIEVVISPRTRKGLGITTLPKKTVEEDWVRWVRDDVVPAYERELRKHESKKSELALGLPPDPKEKRRIKRLRETHSKLRALLKPVDVEDPKTGIVETKPELLAGWVYEWGGKDKPDEVYATFRPVKVGRLARTALWPKAHQYLLMTATPISAEQLLQDDLGLEEGEWAVVEMESTFPVERRPIIVDSRADMTFKKKDVEWPKMKQAIDDLIAQHPGQRILIHTVSYALTKYLYEQSGSPRVMTYWNSKERDGALRDFLARPDSVLLAPSFERGIDLPQEDCRLIIVAKVPFPFLGDKRVGKRLYGKGGPIWYAVQTIRSLAQMTGRGMRSRDDFCKTIILDQQFRTLYARHKNLFPKWWRDAIILGGHDPKSQRRLEAVAKVEAEVNKDRAKFVLVDKPVFDPAPKPLYDYPDDDDDRQFDLPSPM